MALWKRYITMIQACCIAEYNVKLIPEVLRGKWKLSETADENSINPNMLRSCKKEFIDNAGRVFDESKQNRESRGKEETLKNENEQMLKQSVC